MGAMHTSVSPSPTPPASAAALHLARVGSFTDMHGQAVEVTAELLAQLAASYDPLVHRAPLVIGHPQTNSPAFGWLERVTATDAGLFGTPTRVDPAFAAAVRDARYPHRSLSFWPAGHPGSPVPGQPYIRHLGVLGATAPAIPGLQGADLAAADGALTITIPQPSPLPIPELAMAEPSEIVDLAARTAAVAERERDAAAQAAALDKTKADLDRRAQDLAAQEEAALRATMVAFASRLADEARLRPVDVPAIAEILLRLGPGEPAVCFAAPTAPTQPAPGAGWLRGFLSALPPLVELAERATKARVKGAPSAADDAKVARRAQAFKAAQDAAGHPISFAAAVAAVEADEDLTHVA